MSAGASKSVASRHAARDDIRNKRIALEMSRSQLAREVGSHAQTIEKIESGEITWSRFLPAIEHKLGITKDKSPTETAKMQDATPSPQTAMSEYLSPIPAFDIEGISYSLAHSPDGKRKALMILWTLKDGSNIRGAMDARMIIDAARQFHRVAKACGIDLAKLSTTESDPD